MTDDQSMSDAYENDLYYLRMARETDEERMVREALGTDEDEALGEYWRLHDLCHQMFGCIMPNDHRLKDCTNAEMAGFARAWKMEAMALNKLWDEAAAVLDPPREGYGRKLPDVVFHTLLTTLLSLARHKGADTEA
jgi:hypothetical protein